LFLDRFSYFLRSCVTHDLTRDAFPPSGITENPFSHSGEILFTTAWYQGQIFKARSMHPESRDGTKSILRLRVIRMSDGKNRLKAGGKDSETG
jgi:hypothetical protein